MLRQIYDRVLAAAGHRNASRWLALTAFAESSFFPVPPDVLLVPMVLARPAHWLKIATICTAASVAGGLAGYLIGLWLFTAIGQPLLDLYGYGADFAGFSERYRNHGAWIVFIAGLTPFPYKVITIASGATALDLPVFIAASVLARGLRFYLVAALLWKFGPPVRILLERHFTQATILFCAVLIGGFLVIKYLP